MSMRIFLDRLLKKPHSTKQDRAVMITQPANLESLEPRILFSGSPVEAPEEPQPASIDSQSIASPNSEPAVDNDAILAFESSLIQAAADAEAVNALAAEASAAGLGDLPVTLIDPSTTAPSLNQETLDLIAEEAAQRWINSGLNPAQLEALQSISYQIADLPATQLGSAHGTVITIDVNAWGQGWFADQTPLDDSEFDVLVSTSLLRASGGEAATGIDLLSVVMHEQGHVLGLADTLDPSRSGEIMFQGFAAGQRRLPVLGEALGATPGEHNDGDAAVFAVNSTTDGVAAGTLRAAIIAANAAATDDIINLGTGSYTLTLAGINEENSATGDLDIRNNGTLLITGMGKGMTIIDAAQLDRVFDIFDGATVEFRDLTITGGFLDYSHGAGIYARFGSTVTLTDVEITGNTVQTPNTVNQDRHGGGIWANQATITGNGVDITNNTAQKSGAGRNSVGGGMWMTGDSSISFTDFTMTGNVAREGGGFYTSGGNFGGSRVTLNNATIENNTAVVRGGGFYNAAIDSQVTINGGTVSNNVAQFEHGGGFYNYAGVVTLNGVAISNNQAQDLDTGDTKRDDSVGGGFYNSTGTITMTGGAITGNVVYGSGGGFYNRVGTVTITGTALDKVEIENNKSGAHDGLGDSRNGGGFYNTETGTVNLSHTTFVGNHVRFATAGDSATVTGLGAGFFNTGESTVNLDQIDISHHIASEGGAFYQEGVKSMVVGTGVTLDNNVARTRGGAFRNATTGGVVDLTDSVIRGNTALNEHGGGFYNNGTVILSNTAVNANTTQDLDNGIITNLNAPVNPTSTAPNIVQRDGYGAGFYNAGGRVTLAGGTVNANQSYGNGGGFTNSGGIVTANGTTINGNSILRDPDLLTSSNYNRSGAGFSNDSDGQVNLISVTLTNNLLPSDTNGDTRGVGGGFYNNGAFVNISGSTVISGNRAEDGAGFYSDTTGSVVTISGTDISKVQIINNVARVRGGAFRTTGNTIVNLEHVDITGNAAEIQRGGAIYADGARIIGSNVKINDNHAGSLGRSGDEEAGGLWLDGNAHLELTDSEVKGNRSEVHGGGIYTTSSTVTLTRTTVSENLAFNSGGGVFVNGPGRVDLVESTITDNIARDNGGGIYASDDSVVTALNAHIDHNITGYELDGVTRRAADLRGGGFYATGRTQVTLTDSTLDGNAAAMYAGGGYVGGETRVNILGSTVAENIGGHHGGAFFVESSGNLNIQNSTISSNWAGFRINAGGGTPIHLQESVGGAIWNLGGATTTKLDHVTVSDNKASRTDGAGLHVSSGSVSATNSILFGNVGNAEGAPTGTTDTQGTITLIGANVLGTHGGTLLGNTAGRITTDPGLAALADIGGFGRTHAITGASSAAGQAINSTVAVDQRGQGRPGANRDLGAYEADPLGTTLTIDDFNVPENLIGGVATSVSATATSTGTGPLTYDWEVRDSLGNLVGSGSGASLALTATALATNPIDRVTVSVTVTDTATGQSATSSRVSMLATPTVVGVPGGTTIIVDTSYDTVDGNVTSIANLIATNGADGKISLREAILAANAAGTPAGNVVITFDSAVTTVTLANAVAVTDENAAVNGDLDITKTNGTIHIIGNGIGVTTISGGGIDRVFDIMANAEIVFKDLKITGGDTTISDHGAGFRNLGGTVVMQNVDLSGNDATRTSDNVGGGFYSARSGTLAGRVIMTGGFIRDNFADSHGGGFYVDDPNMAEALIYLKDVLISGNLASNAADRTDRDGGGFYFTGTGNRLELDNVVIENNSTKDDGGGFYWGGSASTGNFKDVTIRSNTTLNITAGTQDSDGAGFGIGGTRNTLNFTNSEIGQIGAGNVSENDAGGFKMEGRRNVLNLVDVSIAGNSTLNGTGGGFWVVNDTETVNISGNSRIVSNTTPLSGNHGGGFRNDGVVNITGTALNPIELQNNVAGTAATGFLDVIGGAFFNTSNGTVNLTDVIISENQAYSRGGGFFNNSGASVFISSSNPGTDPGEFRSVITNNSVVSNDDDVVNQSWRFWGVGGGFYNESAGSLVDATDTVITANYAVDHAGGFFTQSNFSTVNLTRVDITEHETPDAGAGFFVNSTGSVVNLNTVLIDHNVSTTNHGGGFRNVGIVNGRNVSMTNNAAGINLAGTSTSTGDLVGGAIYNSSGQVHFVDSTLSNNYARGRGGAIYSDGGSTIDISSSDPGTFRSTISGNRVDENSRDGGGLYITSTGNLLRLTGTDLVNNTAGRHGGGFYLSSDVARVELSDVLIDGNIAGNVVGTFGVGGGFYNASAFSTVTVNQVTISDNRTKQGNAGGFFNRGRLIGQDVVISDNIAGETEQLANNDNNRVGGGFFSSGSESITDLTRVVIEDNTSHGRGGGFYADSSAVVRLTDFVITGNSTDQGTNEGQARGGGFWNSGNADVTLVRGEISDNKSFGHGGGFYQQDAGSSVSLSNVTISGNRAGVDTNGSVIHDTIGGGFWAISSTTKVDLNHVTITNNRVNRNGADAGAGFRVDSAGNLVTMSNSIVYGNFRQADTASPIADDIDNRTSSNVDFQFAGTNIVGVRTGNSIGGVAPLTSDPGLGALADNGGFSRTHLPGVGAIDKASGSILMEDQRGEARPLNAAADLGAVEYLVPAAADDTATISEDGPAASIDLTGNDIEGEGGDLSIGSVAAGLGSVAIDAGGDSVTYDPNGQFDYLAVGESVVDTIYYGIRDAEFGLNQPTTFIERNGLLVGEATDFSGSASSAAANQWVERGLTSGNNPNTLNGSRTGDFIQVPDAGGLTGTAPNVTPSVDYTILITTAGTYDLFLRAAGFDGGSDSIFASIVELQDGTGGANSDWYGIGVPGNKNFTWVGGGLPENTGSGNSGSASFNLAAGTYTLRIMPREDGVALDAFALIRQGSGNAVPTGTIVGPVANQTITGVLGKLEVTVNGANDAPVVNIGASQGNLVSNEATLVNITNVVSLSDIDLSDTHSVSIDWGDGSGPQNLSPTTDGSGAANSNDPTQAPTPNLFSADASHTYADNGIYTVTVTVDDGGLGGSVQHTFDVTVNNQAPTAVDDGYAGANGTDEDTLLSVNAANGVLANDTDPAGPADPLVVTGIQNTASLTGRSDFGASIVMAADGSFTYDPRTSAYLQTLAEGETVQDTFTYAISDGDGGPSIATATIEVTGRGAIEINMNLQFPGTAFTTDPGNDTTSDTVSLALNAGNLDIIVNGTTLRSVPAAALGNGFAPHDIAFTGSGDGDTLNLGDLGTNIFRDLTVTGGLGADSVAINSAASLTGALSITTESIGLNASVTTGSTQTYNGSLNLGASAMLKATTIGINGAISLGAHTLTFDVSTGTSAVNGPVSGSGGLVKKGAGRLDLAGSVANTYSGTTSVQAGQLHLNNSGGNAIGGNLDITTGGKVTFGRSNQIIDTGAVTMSGLGSVFNGTSVNGGQLGVTETIASLAVTGGTFNTAAGGNWSITGAGSFTGGAGNTIFLGNSGTRLAFGSLNLKDMTATAGGNVGQVNSFSLYGNSASTLSSITVGTGGLTLENSRLNLRRGSGAGTLGSKLILNGNVTTVGTTESFIMEDSGGGSLGIVDLELSGTPGSVSRDFNVGSGGANLTVSAALTNGSGTPASLTKSGLGTLSFTGGNANTYTGDTTVNGGLLRLAQTAGVTAVNGNIVVNGGGTLTLVSSHQIADTSGITVSGGSISGWSTDETIAFYTQNAGGLTPSGNTGHVVVTGASPPPPRRPGVWAARL
jgi:autotransporter-associated beta strand protein/predicted outer membrane repeat protein